MEAGQRQVPDVGDVSDVEREEEVGENVVGEATGEDVTKERLLREVFILGGRTKMEVLMYEGNLDVEDLLDWIRSMDKYFDYEDVDEERRVRHAVTRVKG
jgi:hypothetical protein